MNKKMSTFYKIYFSVLLVFVFALVCFLAFLYMSVGEYNKGLPETVSQGYFEELFAGKDYDKILKDAKFISSEFETKQVAINSLTKLLEGNISYTSITSKSDDTKQYVVKSGDKSIAGFTLKQNQDSDYEVDSLDISHSLCDISVTALDSSKLYLNGILVSEDYIASSLPHEYAEQLEGYTAIPHYITYKITGLANVPEIIIKDKNGSISGIDHANGVYKEVIKGENDEEICASLLNSAKEYAKCMQNEVGKTQTLKHFVKGSEIYEIIRGVETSFAWDHNGSYFSDESVSEFFRYDENTVSVKISFNHILRLYGRNDHTEPFEKVIFATNIDGKYQIFAMK